MKRPRSHSPTFNDLKLAGSVRNLALNHLMEILDKDYKDKEFQKAVLLKISSNLLPRLNEHTGQDGKDLPTPIINVNRNDSLER